MASRLVRLCSLDILDLFYPCAEFMLRSCLQAGRNRGPSLQDSLEMPGLAGAPRGTEVASGSTEGGGNPQGTRKRGTPKPKTVPQLAAVKVKECKSRIADIEGYLTRLAASTDMQLAAIAVVSFYL